MHFMEENITKLKKGTLNIEILPKHMKFKQKLKFRGMLQGQIYARHKLGLKLLERYFGYNFIKFFDHQLLA